MWVNACMCAHVHVCTCVCCVCVCSCLNDVCKNASTSGDSSVNCLCHSALRHSLRNLPPLRILLAILTLYHRVSGGGGGGGGGRGDIVQCSSSASSCLCADMMEDFLYSYMHMNSSIIISTHVHTYLIWI